MQNQQHFVEHERSILNAFFHIYEKREKKNGSIYVFDNLQRLLQPHGIVAKVLLFLYPFTSL